MSAAFLARVQGVATSTTAEQGEGGGRSKRLFGGPNGSVHLVIATDAGRRNAPKGGNAGRGWKPG
jgi:hypothetical protein